MNLDENNNFKRILIGIDLKFNHLNKTPMTGVNMSKYIERRLNKILIQYKNSLDNACSNLEKHDEARIIKRMKNNKEAN